MFLFNNPENPNTGKAIVIRIALAVIAFYLILVYLAPMLPAPFGEIVKIVVVILAILFLIDLFI